MPDYDLFHFFRLTVGWVATIYATVFTVKSLWDWYIWLASQDRYIILLRRYIIVQGLRIRVKSFVWDALLCVLLSVAFLLLSVAHLRMWAFERALKAAQQDDRTTVSQHQRQ
jgi:hypothetical protein